MQVLIHLPDDVANQFKATVPKRLRSAFEDVLFKLAMEVENDPSVSELESDWKVTIRDGFNRNQSNFKTRLMLHYDRAK